MFALKVQNNLLRRTINAADILLNLGCILMNPAPRRRWLRFSLGALLLFLAVASALLAWRVKSVRDADKAESALRQAGFDVSMYSEPLSMQEIQKFAKSGFNPDVIAFAPRTYWRRLFLGDDIQWKMVVSPKFAEYFPQETPPPVSHVDDALMLSHIDELRAIGRIGELDLRGARTGNETLRAVSSLQHVRILNIRDTRIDDTGLSYIEKMQSLKALELGGFHLDGLDTTTPEGIAHLRKALPTTEISHSGENANENRDLKALAARVKGVISDNEAAIQRDPKDAFAHNILAWIFATSFEEFRNGERAIELATKACELTEWKNAQYLDTLAIAHAETKDFTTAIKWLEKAVLLEPQNEALKWHLELFTAGKPFVHGSKPNRELVPSAESNPAK